MFSETIAAFSTAAGESTFCANAMRVTTYSPVASTGAYSSVTLDNSKHFKGSVLIFLAVNWKNSSALRVSI